MAAGLGEFAALGTAFGWAISSYVHGMVGRRVGAVGVTLLRQPFQLVVLGLICVLLGVDTALSPRAFILLLMSGVLGIAVCDFLLYSGINILGPQVGVLLLSLSAAFTALLGWLFLGEVLSAQVMIGIALTLLGISIVVTEKSGSTLLPGQEQACGKTLLTGVALCIGAAVFQAVSFIVLKEALREDISTIWAAFVRLLLAALALWGAGLFRGWSMAAVQSVRTQHVVFWMLLGSVFFSAGGLWLSSVAMYYAPAGVAVTLISLQPVLITFVGAVWKRSWPSLRVILGALVAFAGTALVCLR